MNTAYADLIRRIEERGFHNHRLEDHSTAISRSSGSPRGFGARAPLAAYGQTKEEYGRLHDIEIGGLPMKLLPMVHPRQAAGLGNHSREWRKLHARWAARVGGLLG
jgi:hypothetical protein